jgi:hypothetical protein
MQMIAGLTPAGTLRLDALAAEGYWGILISPNASLFRHKREAAAKEADELNDLHQAEIALAHANVVDCDMVATAMHKAATMEIATQRAEFEAADAADRRIAATPPESESEEPADSNDSDAESSSEENCWESAAGGLSAAAAARSLAVEGERVLLAHSRAAQMEIDENKETAETVETVKNKFSGDLV